MTVGDVVTMDGSARRWCYINYDSEMIGQKTTRNGNNTTIRITRLSDKR